MKTLRLFSRKFEFVPTAASWYLADLGEARGKQELFTRQSPQRLKALREHALIESAVSSNRIEGVEVDQSRIATIVFGRPLLRDRDEEEVGGYRQALTWIHEQGAKIPVSKETILQIHRMIRGEIWDAGKYLEQNKERYYETLEQSSQRWHEGKHDPWPYINYVLFIIRTAYREFEQRLGRLQSPKGEKTRLVLHAIDSIIGPFNVARLQNKCPNVSVDMIRRILKNLRAKDQVECLGRGQNARWQKTAAWQLGNVE